VPVHLTSDIAWWW